MNRLRSQDGEWVLSTQRWRVALGDTIEVVLRRHICYDRYIVEIKKSQIHAPWDSVENNIAFLDVYGQDKETGRSIFQLQAYGQTHRLTLHRKDGSYVMAINGLLWDGHIIHIRDSQTM